jgi:hypothetical protein
MLDANQSHGECFAGGKLKPFSIEWLRIQHGMTDPFVNILGSRPNSTTLTPNRDIDFIYTFGISITNISTLSLNTPALSDHIGIAFDIDLESFFSSKYSSIADASPQMLSAGNKKTVDTYIDYML